MADENLLHNNIKQTLNTFVEYFVKYFIFFAVISIQCYYYANTQYQLAFLVVIAFYLKMVGTMIYTLYDKKLMQ